MDAYVVGLEVEINVDDVINVSVYANGIMGAELDLYQIDFKMHRDGKGANPREHR
ncbi:hypothetical protein [Photorhabdus australis]|uniref:hypothetical protein n=1 Tax=Photorhabdus australis TaxID=286156 RepID=UPI000AFB9B97|nr:hypothetical protein [Photorhabdus australis]